MFQKKDIIYHGGIGVCVVDEITKLTDKRGDTIMYYGLKALMPGGKTAYIPVENHTVTLRELISPEEAESKKEANYGDLSPIDKYEVDYVLKETK